MIPPHLSNSIFRFILLKPKDKRPFELDWQNTKNYRFDDPALLAHIQAGGNYGVLCGRGGLVVLDCDDGSLEITADEKLPKTLKIRTGGGKAHYYLQTDVEDKVVLKRGDIHYGEVQGTGAQVVAPGSIHPNGGKYEVEDDCEIAYVSRQQLKAALADYWPEEKQPQKNHFLNSDLDDQLRITNIVPTSKLYKRTGDELQGEHPIHGSDTGSNFTVNTSKNVAYCFRHERGGGPLYWLAVMEGVIDCGSDLRGEDFKRTLQIAKDKYGLKEAAPQPQEHTQELTPIEIENLILTQDKETARHETVNNLLQKHKFKTLRDGEDILIYKDGVYRYEGENAIKEGVVQIWGKKASAHDYAEIIFQIQGRTYCTRKDFDTDKNKLAVLNGILDLTTGELEDFSPEKLHTIQLPIKYDPQADCPKIKKFLSEIVETPEDAQTIIEAVGFSLWRDYETQKALMGVGQGENGKSTLLKLIRSFLGVDNVVSIDLQQFSERFSKYLLCGKLANIYPEVSSEELESTAAFKAFTGGDSITADRKNKQPITFVNFAKLFFSANKLPISKDNSHAFLRRWIILKFPHVFGSKCGCGQTHEIKKDLLQELTTPEELSGLLNLAIAGLKRLKENGWTFTLSDKARDIEHEFNRLADTVKAFSDDRLEIDPEGKESRSALYLAYKVYCEDCDAQPITQTKFTQRLKTLIIRLEDCKVGQERGFTGIKIKALTDNDSSTKTQDIEPNKFSTHSTLLPIPPLKNRNIKGEIEESVLSVPNTVLEVLNELYTFDKSGFVSENELRSNCLARSADCTAEVVNKVLSDLKDKGLWYSPKAGFIARNQNAGGLL